MRRRAQQGQGREQTWQGSWRWWAAAGGLVVVGLVLLWVALGSGAVWVLEHADGVRGLRGAERAEALDRVRGRAVAVGTGLLAAAAIYFTARTAKAALDSSAAAQQTAQATQQTAAATQQTAAATEQGMVTGRYTAAIDQLGSDKPDIRLGGVYALERIARDSMRDHPTVMAVLAAFVREHSHDPDAHTDTRPMPTGQPGDRQDSPSSPRSRFRPDLQDALTVIGRRNTDHDTDPINLHGANLHGANLHNMCLRGADLRGADLTGADLRGADMGDANLAGANLHVANLRVADLRGADLTGADLAGANLRVANLRGASLDSANLRGADLRGTALEEGAAAREAGAQIDERTMFGLPPAT